VYAGHPSRPSAVEQGRSQPGSDALALPAVFYQHCQLEDSGGTDTESGHTHAGRAVPSEPSFVDWSIPQQCFEVGRTVGEL
jgi:hypothetical protein